MFVFTTAKAYGSRAQVLMTFVNSSICVTSLSLTSAGGDDVLPNVRGVIIDEASVIRCLVLLTLHWESVLSFPPPTYDSPLLSIQLFMVTRCDSAMGQSLLRASPPFYWNISDPVRRSPGQQAREANQRKLTDNCANWVPVCNHNRQIFHWHRS